jgi:hypothetical protein
MTKPADRDDDAAARERANRLRRRIADLTKSSGDHPERLPGESDAEYVERRMREIDRKHKGPPGSS